MTDQPKPYEPRPHELTAVVNRDLMDLYPGDPDNAVDVARWKVFRQAYHAAQRLDGLAPFPLQLDFELNSTCQLRCGFCLHGQTHVKKEILPYEDYCRVIEEGQRFGLCSIKLNYINEPLLLPDFPRYLRFAREHGILNMYFATNGLLLDGDRARALIDEGVSKVMISLDAATPETFQIMRSSKEFDRVTQNIRDFIALRNSLGRRFPLVRVNFVQTKKNIHELDQFVKQWEGLVDMFGFQRQVQLPDREDDLLPAPITDDPAGFRCSFPFKLMVIDARGDILPCCTFSARPMALGNIRAMSIKQAWDSQPIQFLRDTHLKSGYASIPICKHCVG